MSLTQINKAGLDEIALDHVFTIGASGSSAYTFQGEGLNGTVNNPTLYLTRGKTYRFENGSGGHPIRIQSTSGASGTAYNTGVTNNAGSGTVIVEVQHDAPDVLYYQCTSHAAMNGILYITGALADGGVTTAKIAAGAVTEAKLATNAVTTDKINSGVITNAKLAANAVGTANIADNAVTTAKIAADAVTTAKIAGDAVTSTELAANAVTTVKINNDAVNNSKLAANSVSTVKIADEAVTLAKLPHGTSSNDGKFLRANNGADPTFETITGTTINNNADNRVITGSGTANTLNGESNVTIDSNSRMMIGTTSPQAVLTLDNTGQTTQTLLHCEDTGGSGAHSHINFKNTTGDVASILTNSDNLEFRVDDALTFNDLSANEHMRLTSNGRLGIGTNSPDHMFEVEDNNSSVAVSRTGANAQLLFKSNSVGQAGQIQVSESSGGGVFQIFTKDTGGTLRERARFLTDGGMTFNGDSATANAIDDYEEGTFSPFTSSQISSHSISIPAQAHYIKIGRTCYIWFRMSFSSTSGSAIEGNMPFPCSNPTNSGSNSPFFMPVFPRSGGGVDMGFCYLGSNGTTTFTIYQSNANYATWNFNSGLDQITVNGCYRTT